MPRLTASTLLLILPSLVTALTQRDLVNSTACADIHLILARGTTESEPGSLETLAELITDNNPGTDYENVNYPATDETTTDSYFEGIVAATNQFTAYAELCLDSQIVVLAYSQGAMVIGDMLVGGGGDPDGILGNATAPSLSYDLGDRLTALVLYGDPRHIADEPWDVGNNNVTGKYPRLEYQIQNMEQHYVHKIADYCNVEDPVCASGNNLTAHLVYPELWDTTAAAWVQSMLE